MLYDDGDLAVRVEPNFCSDGYSIPRLLRGFFATAPASLPAAVLHDWLYSAGVAAFHGLSRLEVDKLFARWLKIYRVGALRRRLIYLAVRSGGWTSYNKNNAVFYTGDHHL